ncbi:MAG: TetR/AcrR family transcriptional regulator [Ancrocorticia sp.]
MKNLGGRPRNAEASQSVLTSTIRLLSEHGYAGLRINDIAEASGVAKTTIYRRWPTMTYLVVDAMEHALGQRSFEPTGNIEQDLDHLTEVALTGLIGEGKSLLAVALDIHHQSDPDLRTTYRRRIIDPIREQAILLVMKAQQQGEIDIERQPEALVDAAIGGIIYRIAILGEPMTIDQAKQFWRAVSRYWHR